MEVAGLARQHHALAREGDGRGHDLGQRQAAEAARGLAQPRDHAGHRHRCRADVEHLLGAAEGHGEALELRRIERSPLRPEPRSGHEEVEQRRLTPRCAHQEEPARTGPGEGALGHGRREGGRAHGVHGAPTPRQRPRPGPRARTMPRRNHPDRGAGTRNRYAASSGPSGTMSDLRMVVVASGSAGGSGGSSGAGPTVSTSKTRGPDSSDDADRAG